MIFWASSETFGPAYVGVTKVRHKAELCLNSALAESVLGTFDATFRFIPIVMPVSMHAKYTERSKFRRKDRVIVCAPQLNYETFVSGTFADQLAEYIRGISTCTHMLAKLGAAPRTGRSL